MSIKVAILRTGDQIIADMKEVVSEESPVAYLLKDPQKIVINSPILITDENKRSIELSLSSWIIVTEDKEIVVPVNHVVTVVEPLESVKKMYLEKLDATDN
tara:strand:- start:517 stop:819 length:303 start_codon:yes stop_codon:yes gene_type:complete